MKKNNETAEKYFAKAISEFFSFHKNNFKDEDGFALAPDWNGIKRGIECKSLKLLLETLRNIATGKNIEWTEERMVIDFNNFMKKSMNHNLVKKDFRVAMLNRFKIEILSATYNPQLSRKILEVWYEVMPDYARDFEKDKSASEVISAFLKEQYVLSSVIFSEESAISSVRAIFKIVKEDDFWSVKPLRTVANNLQEFVNRIKMRKNGKRIDTKTAGINIAFNQAFGRD